MDSREMKELIFGRGKLFDKHCPVCGLAIYEGDNGCRKYHKSAVKKEKQKRYSGKSKSVNKWNDYK